MTNTNQKDICSQMTGNEIFETIRVLQRAGLSLEHFRLLRSEKNKLASTLVESVYSWMRNQYKADKQLLSELSPDNFFGPSDWMWYMRAEVPFDFALPMDLSRLKNLLEGPCPFVPGSKIMDTHYLFCVPACSYGGELTVMDFYRINIALNKGTMCSVHDRFWYDKSDFAAFETPRYPWFLMFKGVVPGTRGKEWDDQQRMIPNGYEVPRLVEVVSMCVVFACKNKKKVSDEGINGRTVSVRSRDNNRRVEFNCDIYGGFGIEQQCIFSDREKGPGIFLCRKLYD